MGILVLVHVCLGPKKINLAITFEPLEIFCLWNPNNVMFQEFWKKEYAQGQKVIDLTDLLAFERVYFINRISVLNMKLL